MKKNILILVLCCLICSVFAGEYTLYSGKCSEYNSIFENLIDKDFQIRYDDENNQFYFYISDWINTAWIVLSKEDLILMCKNFNKYFEWEKLAIEKSTKLGKELPESKIKTKVVWKFGDEWCNSDGFDLNFMFFSQNTTRHQLVLYSNKVSASRNQFITYKIDGLYFDLYQVKDFYEALDESKLDIQIQKIKSDKEIENLFN